MMIWYEDVSDDIDLDDAYEYNDDGDSDYRADSDDDKNQS